MQVPDGALFNANNLLKERDKFVDGYLQLLEVPSLEAGIYVLATGAKDNQTPHSEDEIYFVLSGQGTLRVELQDFEARPGAILFVRAKGKHYFHTITEELRLLVFFSKCK